ncbi:MAG TPA: cyclase family protein [Bryobacteraceae bacterium]|jgi:kynurenine formamidase
MKPLNYVAAIALFAGIVIRLTPAVSSDARQYPRELTKADVDRWMSELSNWGRWGKDDQSGTANLITPAKRLAAARLVTEGFSVSLSRQADTVKAVDNSSPWSHIMTATGDHPVADQFDLDTYSVSYHGYGTTHLDALCHMFYKGRMFNGFPQSAVTQEGASKLDVTHFMGGIFTRGVLIDIPQLKGVPYLEPDVVIYPKDLDAWEQKAGVHVESGDVVFIRTGRWARRTKKGPWDVAAHSAGLYASCAKWLHERDVAMLGSDAASDVMPSRVPGVNQPIHQLVLIALGTPLFDNCDLEALSKAAHERHRYTFLLTAAPLVMPGGTGSPLNPIATF